MCAVTATRSLVRTASGPALASERNRCGAACVAWKPRHRKLSMPKGSKTRARRKAFCAGRSSAENRRSRSHISTKNLEQPDLHEPAQEFRQVGAKQFRFDIEFSEELLVGRVNVGGTRQQLPHARAGLVQSEVLLGLEIQQDRFAIKKADQHMGRGGSAVRKRNHGHGSYRRIPARSSIAGGRIAHRKHSTGDCGCLLRTSYPG